MIFLIKRKIIPDKKYLLEKFYIFGGRLFWKAKDGRQKDAHRWNTRYANKAAGTVGNTGYVYVKLEGKRYLEHRLCFMIYNGYCPDIIDHIDGNKLNNSDENLRESNYLENNNNRHTKEIECVYEKCGIFSWQIQYEGKYYRQSGYATKEEALIEKSIARDLIHRGLYNKREKKRRDNSTGLTCIFMATREKTYFYKFVYEGLNYCKYGFSDKISCAVALEKERILIMGVRYKPSNISIFENYKERICED